MSMWELKTEDVSLSKCQNLKYQGVTVINDSTRKPCQGTYTLNGVTIRFSNGLLQGGKDNLSGLDIPAYETEDGHYEYWESGLLHRENGLPAVISDWGDWEEYWVHGQLIMVKSTNPLEINFPGLK